MKCSPALEKSRGRRRPALRRRVAAALVALFTAVFIPLNAGSANAALGDLTCLGNFQFNFSPALTATTTTANATVVGGLVDCVSLTGYSRLTSGYRTGVGAVNRPFGTLPCLPIMKITESATLVWNTGEVSTFDITVNTDPAQGPITISAYFTSGPLAGDTANAFPVLHPNLDCLTAGLTQLTSPLLVVTWA